MKSTSFAHRSLFAVARLKPGQQPASSIEPDWAACAAIRRRLHDEYPGTHWEHPLIKLTRVAESPDVEIYAKCEFINPGGSIKDRMALRMI